MFMFFQKRNFAKLYKDLEIRVKEENKTDASWLMGYMQGLGNRQLTGYQFAALVDLLLVNPNPSVETIAPVVSEMGVGNEKNLTFGSSASSGTGMKINLRP